MTTTVQQPLAVRAINAAGAVARRLGVSPRLDVASLLAAAQRKTGLRDFGSPEFRRGLDVLVASLEHEARLTPVGRIAARTRLVHLLETRLRLLEHRRRNPHIADQ